MNVLDSRTGKSTVINYIPFELNSQYYVLTVFIDYSSQIYQLITRKDSMRSSVHTSYHTNTKQRTSKSGSTGKSKSRNAKIVCETRYPHVESLPRKMVLMIL